MLLIESSLTWNMITRTNSNSEKPVGLDDETSSHHREWLAQSSRSDLKFPTMGWKMKRLMISLLVILTAAIAVNAQTFRGAINGTVTDPSGAVVPSARVKAVEVATGVERSTVTTSDGQFAIQDIP